MTIGSSIAMAVSRFFEANARSVNGSSVAYGRRLATQTGPLAAEQRSVYRVLKAFYDNNGLYERLRDERFSASDVAPKLKPIRNPVPAVIDFFGSKSWPDPLRVTLPDAIATDPDHPLIQAIEKVWEWSNWRRRRLWVARGNALYGEMYLKVTGSQERGRVWFEVIEPEYVYDFEEDERDNITWIRLDVPKCRDDHTTGETTQYTRTEIWSKEEGSYRIWETDGDAYGRPIGQLGTPLQEGVLAEVGIDFVPFVRLIFKDAGDKRAIGAAHAALEAVIEADLMATNLHGVLFGDLETTVVLRSEGTDDRGRPLPPPSVRAATPEFDARGNQIRRPGQQPDGSVTVGNRSLWRLPGNQRLEFMVPPIAYDAALAIQVDHDTHLERLMPAMAYAKIVELEGGDLSGKAIRFKLTPAIDQVEEVRANLLEGLARANAMAVTVGIQFGIPDFRGLGSYDAGTLAHGFEPTDPLPVGEYDEALTKREEAQAFASLSTSGMPMQENLVRTLGYSEDEAERVVSLATAETDAAAERQIKLMSETDPNDKETDDDESQPPPR